MSDFKPTEQQQAIFDHLFIESGHLAVNAVAGAGKTSTLVRAAGIAGRNTGFAAFNTHIVDELQRQLGDTAKATTLHGLGFRLLQRAFPGIELEERKTQRIWQRIAPKHFRDGTGKWEGRKFPLDQFAAVAEVVKVIKQQLLLAGQERGDELIRACYRQDIDLPKRLTDRAEVILTAQKVAYESIEDERNCDFDDMVSMPIFRKLLRPEFATLFVDESQDLNPAQQELALGCSERTVVVGDPRQAIMGFAGADKDAFPNLVKRLTGCGELPLSWCFRCPTSHLDLARELVPHIEATPWAKEGHIANRTLGMMCQSAQPGDMAICRNNAPLLSLAYGLIRNGKPVMVRGRKIGDGLVALVKRLRADSILQLLSKLRAWEDEQLDRLAADDAPESAQEQVRDKANCIRCLCENGSSISSLLAEIGELFSDEAPAGRIMLSSVHRAKGLEAERVWIYEPGIMPGFQPDQQELNLLYVALTRSKSELYLVDHQVRRKAAFADPLAWVQHVAGGGNRFDLTEKPERKAS